MTSKKILSVLVPVAMLAACGGSETPAEKPVQTTTTTDAPAKDVAAIPPEMGALSANIIVNDVDKAMAFYAEAFGGTPGLNLPGPDGKSMHGEVKFGDSVVMISLEDPARGAKAPTTLGGTNGSLMLYVEDVDAVAKTALDAGAKAAFPVEDKFWGDRYGAVTDPFGHMWGIATHKEDVSPEEMGKRAAASIEAMGKGKKYKTPAPATLAKSWKPEGYKTITATIVIGDADATLKFYTETLGAELADKMPMPDGRLMHATLKLDGQIFHVHSEFPEMSKTTKAATNLGGSPVSLYYYVTDVDASFKAAVAGGATQMVPPTEMFWGDRWGMASDPSGTFWGIATHKKDLTEDEIKAGMAKQFGGQK